MYNYYNERENEGDTPYTDLALERRRADTSLSGIEYKKEIGIYGIWERITVSSEEGARSIGKPMGIYDTLQITRMDLLDEESIEDSVDEIARELCYLCDSEDIIPERLLIVGLGNPALTPDSVGVKCADAVKPTMHIKEHDEGFFYALECSEIAVITPGVASVSGLDSFTTVKGVSDIIKPDAIIAIDALASRSAQRLGTTIQLSTTGILPGSGLGNPRRAISREEIGCPVIGIGIPTVIDSRLFSQGNENTDNRQKKSREQAMFVSPKEINEIVSVAARIVGGAINQAFGMPI